MAYVTHDDIRKIACFSEDTLLAVKAPFGSTLEVPDPDEGMPPGRRRYEIQLTSRSGPIDVFLIQDNPAHSASYGKEAKGSIPSNSILVNNTLDSTTSVDLPETETMFTAMPAVTPGHVGHTPEDDTLLKHFQLPSDPYNFELKTGEGIADLYGFNESMFTQNLSQSK